MFGFKKTKDGNRRVVSFMGKSLLTYEKKYTTAYWRSIYEPQITKLETKIKDIEAICNADIINVWRKDTLNQGDINCAPCLYFSELQKNAAFIDICKFPISLFPKNKCIIVGGGGLFQDYFSEYMKKLYCLAESNKVIIWGAGLDNYVGVKSILPGLKNIHMVGIRDFGNGLYPYVPCVSCMSTLFDNFKSSTTNCSVKLYLHDDYSDPILNDLQHIPFLSNRKVQSYRQAIEFLSDAEIILTNSYHGMYWATLLGKKVVALPWVTRDNRIGYSQKFKTFQYQPIYCVDWKNYREYAKDAIQYPRALEECRGLNRSFFENVKKSILS